LGERPLKHSFSTWLGPGASPPGKSFSDGVQWLLILSRNGSAPYNDQD
jgi:hypothetical protein